MRSNQIERGISIKVREKRDKLYNRYGHEITPAELLNREFTKLHISISEAGIRTGLHPSYLSHLTHGDKPFPGSWRFFERLEEGGFSRSALVDIVSATGRTLLLPTEHSARYLPALRYGQLIKTAREALGISQYRLATLSGVNNTYLSKLESGQRGPIQNPDTNTKLAEALQLTEEQEAKMLLVGGPPRWLVPILDEAVHFQSDADLFADIVIPTDKKALVLL